MTTTLQDKVLSPAEEHGPLFDSRFLKKACIAVALVVALLFTINVTGRWIGKRIVTGGQSTSTEIVDVRLGQDRLRVPANTIRFASQRQGGDAERLDIYLSWPDMEGYSAQKRLLFDDPEQVGSVIFLQISRSTMSRDMSGRLEYVYSGLFEGEPRKLRHGLVMHNLRPDSGYGNEVIITAPREGQTDYVVRCLFPANGKTATGGDCQRDINAGKDLTVLYRFSSSRLADWQAIDAAVTAWIAGHSVQ